MTTTMIDPVERICKELGVCREEALCYLDGFQWNLDSALEACRNKTLPLLSSLTVDYTPMNEKPVTQASSTPPLMIDSRVILNPSDAKSRNQCIEQFCEAVGGASREVAYAYLRRCNWDVALAIGYFMDGVSRPTPPQKKRHTMKTAQSYLKPLKIGSSYSDSMEVGSTGEHIPKAIPLMVSSPVKIRNIQGGSVWPPMDTWVDRVCYDAKVSREEALYYLEGFKWKFGPAMEACRRKTLPEVSVSEESAKGPSNSSEQPSQTEREEAISSFCHVVGVATREEAISFLKRYNWNVDLAVGCYMDRFSEYDMSAAIAMSLMENRGLPLSSVGLPSQSQVQAGYLKEGEIGSSSSSMEVDPTELERSLKEAGQKNAAVAIPGMVSSQVDGKAVEEDSSMKTFPDPVAIQEDRIVMGPRASTS